MQIFYTILPCPLGHLLIAATDKGICAVRLGDDPAELKTSLQAEFPAATLLADDTSLAQQAETVLAYLRGKQANLLALPLDIRATAFQERVWQALRTIPYGETRSYAQIARQIEQPTATRAVAHACASNPVALVIPCHRVVGSDGELRGYRWGKQRKQYLLDLEKRPATNH